MDIILGIIISFVLLISGVYLKIFVGYPLIISLVIFIFIAKNRGYKYLDIIKMAYQGGKKAFIVLRIFVIIGAIISIWMASGTVPAIVYYGIKLLNPNIFILSAFIITCFVSFLIGTSFGTIGTAGIALMVMARSGGVNSNVLAGAIIAGAYFGDRCSPMSSSANLVAALTETDLYKNVRNMFKTSVIPFALSVLIYLFLSFMFPLKSRESGMDIEIMKVFSVNLIVLIPAFAVLILALIKVDVKLSMLVSIIIAWFICIFVQHDSALNSIKYIIFGYKMDINSPLSSIMQGGGILSMLKVAIVVFISSAFSGIFEGTSMLKSVENYLKNTRNRENAFFVTVLVSIATAAFGCSQALAIILTEQLTKKTYENMGLDKYELSLDIENTAVVIAPLIPWNIAGLVPATSLMVGAGFIPFAFYLFLIPAVNMAFLKFTPKLTQVAG